MANSDAAEHISVNSQRDSASSNSTTNDGGRNWRAALMELDSFFADIDLFTPPFLSSVINDETLHLTLQANAGAIQRALKNQPRLDRLDQHAGERRQPGFRSVFECCE
jgi:hypothetical protein